MALSLQLSKFSMLMKKIFTFIVLLFIVTPLSFWLYQKYEKNLHIQRIIKKYEGYRGLTKRDLKKIPKKDRPDLAKLQDYLRTMDPQTGKIPLEAKLQANIATWNRIQSRQYRSAIPGIEWQERGPNNVGGRTRALMYDPNDGANGYKKVWAGGVAGGLWVCSDITQNPPQWQNINDFWENIAISTIAYDPSNTQIFYVGTGEAWFNADAVDGAGVWKTTDGGLTWNHLASTINFRSITKIVVANNGNVILGDRNQGLQVSTDGGTTWTPKTTGWISDIEVAANGRIYAAKYLTTGFARLTDKIYLSTDNGVTFTDVSAPLGVGNNGERIELACAPSNANVIYAIASDHAFTGGGAGNIQWFKKTTDGGNTWSNVTIPTYVNQATCGTTTTHFTRGQAWYDLILAVNPSDPNHVIAGGIDLHRTTNGGTSWQPISYWTGNCYPYVHADIHAIAYKPSASTEIIVGHDGGISWSNTITSANPSFIGKSENYNVTQFYSVAMAPSASTQYFLGGAQDNGSNKISGLGLQPSTEVTGGDGGFAFIDQTNPCIQITSYTNNSYYVSSDGGQNFSNLGTQDPNTGDFINPADYDDNNDLLYSSAAGHAGGADVARWTVPAGAISNLTITSVGTNTVTHLKVSPYSPAGTTTLYVGTNAGQVIRIPNAHTGTSFAGTVISNATMHSQGSVSCIEFGTSENEIIVTYSNYGVQNVWYTNNGGTTWVSKDNGHGLPNMPVRWALFNPNDTRQVILATETGVWSTNDITAAASSTFWEPSVLGLANTRCDMFQIRNSDQMVAIATHGRGIFTTSIFGTYANFEASKTLAYTNQTITFTDYSGGATSWSWNFGAGATPATATGKGPHNVVYSTSGNKTITLTINGSLSKTLNITILPDRTTPYNLTDGGNFETNPNDFAPSPLNTSNPSGCASFTSPTQWERGNSAIAGKNGTVSGANAWVTSLTSNYLANSKCYLYSPNFDFSTVGCTYTLNFYIKMNAEANYDGMIVEYSTDKGTTWTKLNNTVAPNWYNNTTNADAPNNPWGAGTPLFTGNFSNYTLRSCDVSFLAGNANVAFRFYFASDFSVNGPGIAIDDFTITKTGCPVTPTITLGTISPTTYCQGDNITVPFTTSGTFNAGNTFTAQLSDETGSFAVPITTQSGNSPITLSVPISAIASSNYKIRVVSSNPAVISDLSPNITINPLPSVTLTSNDADNSICAGTNVTFTATAGYANYNFRVNAVSVQNGASNTFSTNTLANGDVIDVIVTSGAGCSNLSNSITMAVVSGSSPTVQASALVFSSLASNSVKIEWENGNGTGRIVLMKANSNFNPNPLTDHTIYNANSTFGLGDIIDGGYVVYEGTGSNVTVNGLTSNTLYYVAVFEYNQLTCRPQKTAATLTYYQQTSPANAFITTNTTWVGIFSPSDIVSGTSMNYPVGNEPDKAIDNNLTTQYINNDITNQGLIVQKTSATVAKRISITTGTNNIQNDPVQITLEGSNDGVTYSNITTFKLPSCIIDRAYTRIHEFNNNNSYLFYRVIVDVVNSGCGVPNAFQITEVQLFREATPLPVQLVSFDANLKSDLTTLLSWTVNEEQSVYFYELEKTFDFNSIQSLTQISNTNQSIYTYLDTQKWTQKTYYRLKIVDINGGIQLSEWKEVIHPLLSEILIVYPQPVKQEFFVQTNYTIQKLELFNSLGQKVQEWNPSLSYNSQSLSRGIYTLVVYTDKKTFKQKLDIQ